MAASGFFPNMVTKMTQIGEGSGSLPEVLDRTSDFYEKKVDTTVKKLTGFLEPALIITVGAIVLVVVLALYLPIFTMSDANM
jgi:type IV pilus assembly protein PilC